MTARPYNGKPFTRTHTMERLPMTPLEKLGEALETCIVACQGRRNTERAQAVLDVIKEQGWTLTPPGEDRREALDALLDDAFAQGVEKGLDNPGRLPEKLIGKGGGWLADATRNRLRAALLPPEEEK